MYSSKKSPHCGERFVFEDKIVGGVVPRQYIPAVEKVLEAMEGNLAGAQSWI